MSPESVLADEAREPAAGQERLSEPPAWPVLTVVFSDLGGAGVAGGLESEHYARLLQALRQLGDTVLSAHGGRVLRLQGDGVLAVFGLPQPQPDDTRRAIEAVLDLHERVRALRPPVRPAGLPALVLHSGLHAGPVQVGPGDAQRGRLTLSGDVPDLAVRLSMAAGRDELLVSLEALGPQAQAFLTEPREPLILPGRDRPVALCRVRARVDEAGARVPRRQRALLPFVGREAELAWLEEAAATVGQTGTPVCRLLLGVPGLGKTRLLGEFAERSASRFRRVLTGHCERQLSAEPLQPFLQMLPGTEPPRRIDARDAAGDPVTRLCERLLEQVRADAPVLLCIDDWQWADEAALQLLMRLRRQAAGLPLMIVLTARDLSGAERRRLDMPGRVLAPFSDEEADRTVHQLLPSIEPVEIDSIRRLSGGNALYIEELCHALLVHAELRRQAGRPYGGAAWLDRLIEARLARLPEPVREVLQIAAVIGVHVPVVLLSAVTGEPVEGALARLAAEDVLFPDVSAGRLRFKHGITRDVIYRSIGLAQRQQLHRRVAAMLAGTDAQAHEALAHHWHAAGVPEQALEAAERAADRAQALSSLDRAREFHRLALAAIEALPSTPALRQRWFDRVQRLALAGVFDAARADLEVVRRAVSLAMQGDDVGVQARMRYWLAYMHYALGEAREAVREGREALVLARRAGDAPLEVQVRATLGQALASAARYPAALALLDDAGGIKRRHRSGRRPSVGLAYTLTCQAAIHGDQGRFELAGELFGEALEAAGEGMHEIGASIRGWQAVVLLWQGRWQEAATAAAQAHRIGEQVRSLFSFSMSHAAGSFARWRLDPDGPGLQGVRDATVWLAPRDGGLFASLNHGWLAEGEVERGQPDRAREQAALALARARRGDWLGAAMASRALARLAGGSAPQQAWHHLVRAERAARCRHSAHEQALNRLARVRWLLQCGRDRTPEGESAVALLDEAEAAFTAMSMSWHVAQVARLRGMTGT